MMGGPAGNLLSSGVLALLGILLGEAAFLEWGWRVAFLASGTLIGVGAWMRTRVHESPLYQAYVERRTGTPSQPLWPTLLAHWRSVVTVFVVKVGENALFYVFTTFFVVYLTKVLHLPRTLALEAASLGAAVEVVVIIAAGAWSDRIGRRAVTALGLIAAALWAFLLFPVTASGAPGAIFLAAMIGGACHGMIVGGMSAMFVELFPTAARYTGFSVGYQLASVAGGAVAPIIGVALLDHYGATLPVSLYALGMALPALLGVALVRETRGADLSA
jgi:MFS family permease